MASQVAVILTAAAEVMTSAKIAGRSLGREGSGLGDTAKGPLFKKGVGYLGGISHGFLNGKILGESWYLGDIMGIYIYISQFSRKMGYFVGIQWGFLPSGCKSPGCHLTGALGNAPFLTSINYRMGFPPPIIL